MKLRHGGCWRPLAMHGGAVVRRMAMIRWLWRLWTRLYVLQRTLKPPLWHGPYERAIYAGEM